MNKQPYQIDLKLPQLYPNYKPRKTQAYYTQLEEYNSTFQLYPGHAPC